MALGVCKLCGKDKHLIRAHIVPKGLYPNLNPNEPFFLYSTQNPNDVRSPIGVYDPNMICGGCDNEFGEYDRVAKETFLANVPRSSLLKTDQGLVARGTRTKYLGYFIDNPSVQKLQLFAASLIWRSTNTERSEFNIKISDDFYEKILRLLSSKSENDYLGLIGARLYEEHLSEFVSRPTVYDGDFGEGVNFWFSGMNLLVLATPPALNVPYILGQAPSWWIRYESVWDTKVAESMNEIQAIRNPERQIANG